MIHFLLFFLLAQMPSAGKSCPCEPKPEIKDQIQRADAEYSRIAASADGPDFDKRVAPFLALRNKYPEDLFVNEQYQDAVAANGIEGHLKAMTGEYQVLEVKHYGDQIYHYLFLRSLVGRSTTTAIQGLKDMVTSDPNFAPAHRTLAEIYASAAFHDPEMEKSESKKLLALCPGAHLTTGLTPLPERSTLFDQAEDLLAHNGNPDKIIAMTMDGLRADEWRNQRLRAFDWYSVDLKRKALVELRNEYWRAWTIQVRCYRKAGRLEQAAKLLASMEASAAASERRDQGGYCEALTVLAHLYIEGHQLDAANKTVERMKQYLAKKPDPRESEVLDSLQKLLASASEGSGAANR